MNSTGYQFAATVKDRASWLAALSATSAASAAEPTFSSVKRAAEQLKRHMTAAFRETGRKTKKPGSIAPPGLGCLRRGFRSGRHAITRTDDSSAKAEFCPDN